MRQMIDAIQLVLLLAMLLLLACNQPLVPCISYTVPEVTVTVDGSKVYIDIKNKGEDRYELFIFRMNDGKSVATVLQRYGYFRDNVSWEYTLEPGDYRVTTAFYHSCYKNGKSESSEDFSIME